MRWISRPTPLWAVLIIAAASAAGQGFTYSQMSHAVHTEYSLTQIPLCETGAVTDKLYGERAGIGFAADHCISALAVARYLADAPCWQAQSNYFLPKEDHIDCTEAVAVGTSFEQGNRRLGESNIADIVKLNSVYQGVEDALSRSRSNAARIDALEQQVLELDTAVTRFKYR